MKNMLDAALVLDGGLAASVNGGSLGAFWVIPYVVRFGVRAGVFWGGGGALTSRRRVPTATSPPEGPKAQCALRPRLWEAPKNSFRCDLASGTPHGRLPPETRVLDVPKPTFAKNSGFGRQKGALRPLFGG
jgi:hypothetical protein